jgi:hypothetical protein
MPSEAAMVSLDKALVYWGLLIGGLVGVLGCTALGLLLEPAANPVNVLELASARSRWAARSFSEYRLVIEDDNGQCHQNVAIQDETIVTRFQNDCRFQPRTVTNLFRLIEAIQPSTYRCVDYGCACDTVMSVRTAYDARFGYPTEITFQWNVKANWRNVDYWKYTWSTGHPPPCRVSNYRRTTSVLSLTPIR